MFALCRARVYPLPLPCTAARPAASCVAPRLVGVSGVAQPAGGGLCSAVHRLAPAAPYLLNLRFNASVNIAINTGPNMLSATDTHRACGHAGWNGSGTPGSKHVSEYSR